jgi:hypothetical protein
MKAGNLLTNSVLSFQKIVWTSQLGREDLPLKKNTKILNAVLIMKQIQSYSLNTLETSKP